MISRPEIIVNDFFKQKNENIISPAMIISVVLKVAIFTFLLFETLENNYLQTPDERVQIHKKQYGSIKKIAHRV